jgi:HSP20 family protein
LAPLDNLRREIDSAFDVFRRGFWQSPVGRKVLDIEPFWRKSADWAMNPEVDIVDKSSHYEIRAELPGMEAADIDVKFADGVVTIKGEKKEEKEEKKEDYYLSERRYGSFQRSFTVPQGVDAEKIEANFKNGVLTITLVKSPEAQKNVKKIEIKAS